MTDNIVDHLTLFSPRYTPGVHADEPNPSPRQGSTVRFQTAEELKSPTSIALEPLKSPGLSTMSNASSANATASPAFIEDHLARARYMPLPAVASAPPDLERFLSTSYAENAALALPALLLAGLQLVTGDAVPALSGWRLALTLVFCMGLYFGAGYVGTKNVLKKQPSSGVLAACGSLLVAASLGAVALAAPISPFFAAITFTEVASYVLSSVVNALWAGPASRTGSGDRLNTSLALSAACATATGLIGVVALAYETNPPLYQPILILADALVAGLWVPAATLFAARTTVTADEAATAAFLTMASPFMLPFWFTKRPLVSARGMLAYGSPGPNISSAA